MSCNEVQLKAQSSPYSNGEPYLRYVTTPRPIECQSYYVTHMLHVCLKAHVILMKLARSEEHTSELQSLV